MKVEIVSTQTIRPAAAGAPPSPSTPATAKKYFTLSIFDQLMPALYVPILLFYSATDLQISAKSDILKKSLSETLTHFFPQLAGRISDNLRIVVDEEPAGIEYTEARVRGVLLCDILSPPNLEAIGKLLPAVENSWAMEKLLVVRQSVFECGGMAIGICVSHKVADGAAVSSFLRSWSVTARGGGRSSDIAAAAPYLGSASRFPPKDVSVRPAHPELMHASRRFVLSGSQVASLKAKSRSQSVANPTRVEAVSSLIWQCAIRSKSKILKNPSSSLSSSISQAVNLRNHIEPPLPDTTFGNLVGFYKTSTAAKDEEKEDENLASLVYKMRHAKEEYMRFYPKKLNQGRDPSSAVCESFGQLSGFDDNNGGTYHISSACKFDLYVAGDFGWGKPIWATFYINIPYNVYLSDTRDKEGIQVWLSLPKQQMDVFEKDPLLLSYATPNPSVIHQYQTGPLRRFARVSSPGFHYCPSRLLLNPNSLSQILSRPEIQIPHHYSPPPSIRFISSLLHLHRRHKLIIR